MAVEVVVYVVVALTNAHQGIIPRAWLSSKPYLHVVNLEVVVNLIEEPGVLIFLTR